MSHALIADLGGTNARFALVPVHTCQPQEVQVLPCEEYASFFDAVKHYIALSSLDMSQIDAVVLAIAGPVNQAVIRFSNNPWHFTKNEIQAFFGELMPIALLNDFDAVGHCLDVLTPADIVAVGADTPVVKHAAAWVVGAGTGLGVSCVVRQDGLDLVLPGEGGHVDLPSCNVQEDYILNFLHERHQRVSAERVLSGMGLENIYEALSHRSGQAQRLTAKQIGAALLQDDPLAIATLEQFFVYLGRVIGDLVLTVEAKGGVYIAGGIVPRYLSQLQKSGFHDAMRQKGRMREFVAPIPVFVITAEYPGLMGCANYASHLVKTSNSTVLASN